MNFSDLAQCPVCSAISPENREEFFRDMKYKNEMFKKGDVIARQGDPCKYLYILLKGAVKTEMITETGGQLTIEVIRAPRPLASAFLFAEDNCFPVDVVALEQSVVLMIPRDEVIRLFQKDAAFLQRYITYNSNKTQFLSHKLQILTIKTIKGKLAHYILEQLSICHSISPTINTFLMDKNQTELARSFGVSRPALARTLSEIQQEGAIRAERNKITVLNKRMLLNMLG
jgi:CRP-like cAMP-binding protein